MRSVRVEFSAYILRGIPFSENRALSHMQHVHKKTTVAHLLMRYRRA